MCIFRLSLLVHNLPRLWSCKEKLNISYPILLRLRVLTANNEIMQFIFIYQSITIHVKYQKIMAPPFWVLGKFKQMQARFILGVRVSKIQLNSFNCWRTFFVAPCTLPLCTVIERIFDLGQSLIFELSICSKYFC